MFKFIGYVVLIIGVLSLIWGEYNLMSLPSTMYNIAGIVALAGTIYGIYSYFSINKSNKKQQNGNQ